MDRAAAKVLLEMEGRGVLQDLIPYVGQLEHAYVPIKGCISDPYEYSLLYGPGDMVCLPTYGREVINTDGMTRGIAIVIDGGGCLEMLLEPFPKSLCQVTSVLLLTTHMVTLEPTNYPIFLSDVIPALWGHHDGPDDPASLEMYLNSNLANAFLKLFAESLCVRDYHVDHTVFVVLIVVSLVSVVVVFGLITTMSIVVVSLKSV